MGLQGAFLSCELAPKEHILRASMACVGKPDFLTGLAGRVRPWVGCEVEPLPRASAKGFTWAVISWPRSKTRGQPHFPVQSQMLQGAEFL